MPTQFPPAPGELSGYMTDTNVSLWWGPARGGLPHSQTLQPQTVLGGVAGTTLPPLQ